MCSVSNQTLEQSRVEFVKYASKRLATESWMCSVSKKKNHDSNKGNIYLKSKETYSNRD